MLKVKMIVNGVEDIAWYETIEQLDRAVRNVKLQNTDYLKNSTGTVEYEVLVNSDVASEVRLSKFDTVNINTGERVQGDNVKDIVDHIVANNVVSRDISSLIQTAILTGNHSVHAIGDGWLFTRI